MRSNFAQASLTTLRSGLVALLLLPYGAAHAQEEAAQLNTVLDIETLYEPEFVEGNEFFLTAKKITCFENSDIAF